MLAEFNGEKLSAARKQKHITQESLAEQVNLGVRYLRALEEGSKNNPSAKSVYQMSRVLEISMEELMEYRKDETALESS